MFFNIPCFIILHGIFLYSSLRMFLAIYTTFFITPFLVLLDSCPILVHSTKNVIFIL